MERFEVVVEGVPVAVVIDRPRRGENVTDRLDMRERESLIRHGGRLGLVVALQHLLDDALVEFEPAFLGERVQYSVDVTALERPALDEAPRDSLIVARLTQGLH